MCGHIMRCGVISSISCHIRSCKVLLSMCSSWSSAMSSTRCLPFSFTFAFMMLFRSVSQSDTRWLVCWSSRTEISLSVDTNDAVPILREPLLMSTMPAQIHSHRHIQPQVCLYMQWLSSRAPVFPQPIFSSFHELMQLCGVRPSVRLSVCPSINILRRFYANHFFYQINGWITTKLAHHRPQTGLHPGCAQGQGQRSRDRDLLWFHENRFFSQANGWIATKLAHDGPQKSLHPEYAQGRGQRSRDRDTFVISQKSLFS